MSDLTISTVAITLFLFTPALPFFFWLRITLPPTRVVLGSDFLLILASSIISFFTNVTMFTWLGNEIAVRVKLFGSASPSIEQEIANLFQVTGGGLTPCRPGHRFVEWLFGVSVPQANMFSFVLDLHIRTFAAGFFVFVFIKAFTWLQDYYEYLAYSDNCVEKWAALLIGTSIKDDGSRYIVEKKHYGRMVPVFHLWPFLDGR